jgi:lipopolysaccharide transport system ATP-binding protein
LPPAIDLKGASKAYNVWSSPSARLRGPLLGRLGQLPFVPAAVARRCQRLSQESFKRFYALRDVTLQVEPGETVAIVGRNGSGKSTLLQLVAGILAPTTGSVQVCGRVAALLELGAGFSPDFSGRENIHLSGAILGLSPREVESRCGDIVAFADIGEFIDQPVRTYSSGMAVRLAFAVATSVDADILIVDEALAVGDEAFQRKCYARLRTFQEKGGTILFVSHSAATVAELCHRAVLLDQGELLTSGSPKRVLALYHRMIYAAPDRAAALREALRHDAAALDASVTDLVAAADARSGPSDRRGAAPDAEEQALFDPDLVPRSTLSYESRGAVITGPRVLTRGGRPVNVLAGRGDYVYEYAVRFTRDCFNVRFGMLLRTLTGLDLGGAVSATPGQALDFVEAGTEVTMRFQFRCLLAPGVYFLNAGVLGMVDGTETFLHRIIDAAMVRVPHDAAALVTGTVDFCAVPDVAVRAPETVARPATG